jgi:hypothetical protein
MSADAALYGNDLFGEPIRPERSGALAERYEFPPFSVLNAREGDWQERKRAWLALGIKSEVGRGLRPDGSAPGGSLLPAADYSSGQRGDGAGRPIDGGKGLTFNGAGGWQRNNTLNCRINEFTRGDDGASDVSGTSIFDPVLCELAYKWWCPPGGLVLDPFAGGSVRGLVAALLGRGYWGCELRPEQVDANEAQRHIAPAGANLAWHCGDARDALAAAPEADFIFTCPPYGDLERYSDDPRDLSTMDWSAFASAYRGIIAAACARLRPDRFAAFVVGDYRDPKTTHYRGFVQETIAAFDACGLGLYNDAVLLTAVGSLPVRISNTFDAGRKLGKTHQNLLVFVKGNWRAAARACGS